MRALQQLRFDGVKIDGCGKMNDMAEYAEVMVRYGLNITIEDCHDSSTDQGQGGLWPSKDYCPWTSCETTDTRAFSICAHACRQAEQRRHVSDRTSNDIQAFAEAWFWNMQTVLPFLDSVEPLSQPHCWAYPDM